MSMFSKWLHTSPTSIFGSNAAPSFLDSLDPAGHLHARDSSVAKDDPFNHYGLPLISSANPVIPNNQSAIPTGTRPLGVPPNGQRTLPSFSLGGGPVGGGRTYAPNPFQGAPMAPQKSTNDPQVDAYINMLRRKVQ